MVPIRGSSIKSLKLTQTVPRLKLALHQNRFNMFHQNIHQIFYLTVKNYGTNSVSKKTPETKLL